jgi:hypothetical protein
MKNRMFSLVLSTALLFFFTSLLTFAQDRPSRFAEQHDSQTLKKNLKTTEKMLLKHLSDNTTDSKLSAVQTLRQLELIFPDHAFRSFIEPLSEIVKNEELETQLRITAAIALDELHSDMGDKTIYEVAKNSTNESVKNVCTAISFEISKTAAKGIVESN